MPSSAVASPSVAASTEKSLTGVLILLGLTLGALWFVCCRQLSAEWSYNEQYNYGWFVPFFALYLFWLRWEDRPEICPARREATILLRRTKFGRQTPGNVIQIRCRQSAKHHRRRCLRRRNPALPRFSDQVNRGGQPRLATVELDARADRGRINAVASLATRRIAAVASIRLSRSPFFLSPCRMADCGIEQPIIQGLMPTVASIATENAIASSVFQPRSAGQPDLHINGGVVGVNEACSGVRSAANVHYDRSALRRVESAQARTAGRAPYRGDRDCLHRKLRSRLLPRLDRSRVAASPTSNTGMTSPRLRDRRPGFHRLSWPNEMVQPWPQTPGTHFPIRNRQPAIRNKPAAISCLPRSCPGLACGCSGRWSRRRSLVSLARAQRSAPKLALERRAGPRRRRNFATSASTSAQKVSYTRTKAAALFGPGLRRKSSGRFRLHPHDLAPLFFPLGIPAITARCSPMRTGLTFVCHASRLAANRQ